MERDTIIRLRLTLPRPVRGWCRMSFDRDGISKPMRWRDVRVQRVLRSRALRRFVEVMDADGVLIGSLESVAAGVRPSSPAVAESPAVADSEPDSDSVPDPSPAETAPGSILTTFLRKADESPDVKPKRARKRE